MMQLQTIFLCPSSSTGMKLSVSIAALSAVSAHAQSATTIDDTTRSLDGAIGLIQKHLAAAATARPAASSWTTCTMDDSEACALSDMAEDTSVLVYPGGDTTCIDGSPYAFQVVRGDPTKVWFNFEEGGACWDAVSGATSLCTQSVDGGYTLGEGLFDRTRSDNPLADFTIVNALYCSGDAFVADAKTQSWKAANGDIAVQFGQQNVAATIDWLHAQPDVIATAESPLASLLIAGQSAGSLGAQAWSNALLQEFPATTRTVMPDSYLGIFPEGSQQTILNETWPMCDGDSPLEAYLTTRTLDLCHAGQLTLQEWMVDSMGTNPTTPHGWIQSKYDAVQISFYIAIATTLGIPPLALGTDAAYSLANAIFVGYDAAAPNGVHFFVEGPMHTYSEFDLVYTATTYGLDTLIKRGASLLGWIGALVASGADQLGTTECYGDLAAEADWSGTKYCATELDGKQFRPSDAAAVMPVAPGVFRRRPAIA